MEDKAQLEYDGDLFNFVMACDSEEISCDAILEIEAHMSCR